MRMIPYAAGDANNTNPNYIFLPRTQEDAIDTEDAVANLIKESSTDYHEFINGIAGKARDEFKNNLATGINTLREYYQKEKAEFRTYIDGEDAIKAQYTSSAKSLKQWYAIEQFLSTGEKSYLHDTSETRASFIDPKNQIAFRYTALLQQHKNTKRKAEMALKIKRNKILLDIAVSQAYLQASIFREDIAKKELNDMLQAVDAIIH
jgi:hypothetical protein